MKEGWEKKTLADTCKMYQPKTITAKEMVQDGAFPVFGANGIIGRYDQYNHDQPQLLITCRGATCGSVNVSLPKSWITGNAMVVRPKDGSVDLGYLEYYFRGGIDISKAITGAAQPQITRANLDPLEIVFPTSLKEQRRIVSVLDEVFAAIATATANAEKNRANARELARHTLLEKTQSLSEGDRRLEEVCTVDWGNTNLTKAAYVSGGAALAVSAAGCDGRIGHAEHQAGVPVLSAIGARCGRMFFPEEPFTAIKNTITFTPRPGKVEGKFLFYLLESVELPQRGAAQPFIAKGDVNKFIVPMPNILDQRRLIRAMDAIFIECSELERLEQRKLEHLVELKQSILQRAFSGNRFGEEIMAA